MSGAEIPIIAAMVPTVLQWLQSASDSGDTKQAQAANIAGMHKAADSYRQMGPEQRAERMAALQAQQGQYQGANNVLASMYGSGQTQGGTMQPPREPPGAAAGRSATVTYPEAPPVVSSPPPSPGPAPQRVSMTPSGIMGGGLTPEQRDSLTIISALGAGPKPGNVAPTIGPRPGPMLPSQISGGRY